MRRRRGGCRRAGGGALAYFVPTASSDGRAAAAGRQEAGPALALGAVLDGIPEQLVLGIGLTSGERVSVGLLAAVFVSNLPEAMGRRRDARRRQGPGPSGGCGCRRVGVHLATVVG